MSLETIPTNKLILGIRKAFINSESLLCDADILSTNGKWAHAYALCQFAIEELSKIFILYKLWIDRINGNEVNYKNVASEFLNHKPKLKISFEVIKQLFLLYKEKTGDEKINDLIKRSEWFLQNIKYLNDLKNESLYVSIIENDFQSPSEIITKEIFFKLFNTASQLVLIYKSFMDLSEQYIYEVAELFKSSIEPME